MNIALPIRGRSSQLTSLDDLLESARAGHGAVGLIEGPAGIGKTRLLREVTQQAEEKGLLVSWGAGDELDQLTPWASLMSALLASAPPVLRQDELRGLDGFVDRRLEVPERMRSALERTARDRPVLVALDDLQWADPATLSALGSVPQQLFSYPIVWLLARRSVPSSPQIEALRARLIADGAMLMRLEPLSFEDATLVAADMLGEAPPAPAAALVTQAGGNPLYLTEMLRNVHHSSLATDRVAVAPSLSAAVEGHLRLLSEPARQFLKVASIFGGTFSVEEVAAVTGQSATALLGEVEETIRSDVIIERGEELCFRHDLFRRAVYDDLPQAMRPALHRDAARALLAAGAPVIRVAAHLAIGARPGEEQDIDALTRAAVELFGTSPGDAADLAVRVVDLVPTEDPRRPAMVAMAVSLLGFAGRPEEARALGEGFVNSRELPLQAEADIYLGILRAWGMHSLVPCPVLPPSRLVSDPGVSGPTRAKLMLFPFIADMWTEPEQRVDQSLAEAATLDASDISVLSSIRAAFRIEHARLLRATDEAFADLAAQGPAPEGRQFAVVQHALGMCLATVGRLTEAREAFTTALDAAAACGDTFLITSCRNNRAMVLLELGRLDDASSEAAAAIDIAERLGFEYHVPFSLFVLAEAALRLGDIDEAEATAARVPREQQPDPTGNQAWLAALCAEARGRSELVLECLAPMIDRMARGRLSSAAQHPSRLPQVVAMTLRAGDRDRAAVVAEAAAEIARRNPGLTVAAANEAHCRGLLEGNLDHLRRAVAMLDGCDRPLAIAAAREDLGHLLATAGQKAEAIDSLESAHEIFETGKARHDVARTRAALFALGVRKRRPSVARPDRGWASLTDTELTVVRLVAQGRTNREAAAELYVSPETINTHLRHAFPKLGVRSRVELARLVIEHDQS